MSTTTTYLVTGMTCGHCVAAVTEEIGRLDGVSDVDVDLVAGGDVAGHGHQHRAAARRRGPGGRRRGRIHPGIRTAGERCPAARAARPRGPADAAGDRAADRRHDLRLVRRPDREEAQPARRRRRPRSTTPPRRPRSASPTARRRRRRSVATVEATGYTADPAAAAAATPPTERPAPDAPSDAELGVAAPAAARSRAALTVPVLLLAMIPALQFTNWQWLSLTLAAPVVVWGAWPFHRAAWTNLRHGAATMDTLISVGVLAAFGWSLYALFFGDAGDARA